jgi:hypothetical protein
MTEAELSNTILDPLVGIVPEADFAALAPGRDLREELDIDPMDFLNVVIAFRKKLTSLAHIPPLPIDCARAAAARFMAHQETCSPVPPLVSA